MKDRATETERLFALMNRYGVARFHYADGSRTLDIVKGVTEDLRDGEELLQSDAQGKQPIRSPSVGRFRQRGPKSLPMTVTAGEILGFVTTGSLRLPVVAPDRGIVLAVRHPDDTPVAYDTVLYDFNSGP